MVFIVIGNMLSVIAYLLGVLYINCKNKDELLKIDLLTSGVTLLSMCFLQSLSGILNTIITLLRVQTIRLKDKSNKKCYSLFLVFLIFYMSVFLDYKGIETILLFVSSMFSFIPKWFSKDAQLIRISGAMATITILYWQISIMNYGGAICGVVSLFMTFAGLYKNRRKKEVDEDGK